MALKNLLHHDLDLGWRQLSRDEKVFIREHFPDVLDCLHAGFEGTLFFEQTMHYSIYSRAVVRESFPDCGGDQFFDIARLARVRSNAERLRQLPNGLR